MSNFCPDGYLPSQTVIVEATQCWFADRLVALEATAAADWATGAEPKSGVNALAQALSRPPLPNAVREAFMDIVAQTVERLRNVLFEGKLLKAYYFDGLFHSHRAIKP